MLVVPPGSLLAVPGTIFWEQMSAAQAFCLVPLLWAQWCSPTFLPLSCPRILWSVSCQRNSISAQWGQKKSELTQITRQQMKLHSDDRRDVSSGCPVSITLVTSGDWGFNLQHHLGIGAIWLGFVLIYLLGEDPCCRCLLRIPYHVCTLG